MARSLRSRRRSRREWQTTSGGDNVTGNDTSNAPGSDSGGDTFQTSNADSVGGRSQSTVTNAVNTDDGHGNTVHSTDTVIDNGVIGGMDSNGDQGSESFADANSQPTSDTEQDTDRGNGLAQSSDKSTDNFGGTFVTVDPATGMRTTVGVTDGGTDQESNLDVGTGKDVHAAFGTTGSTSTDDVTFDDNRTNRGTATDNPTIIINASGTNSQGNQVNLQETITMQLSATSLKSDEDTGTDDTSSAGTVAEQDAETLQESVQATAGITDVIGDTVVATDAATGIKTTTTDAVTITGNGNDTATDSETDVRHSGSPDNDTATQTDNGSLTAAWNGTEHVTRTNPDGSVIGTPTTQTDIGNDTVTTSDTLTKSADGTGTNTPGGTETGGNSTSGANAATTAWSNQPVSQTTLNSTAANAAFVTTVAAEDAAKGGPAAQQPGTVTPSGGGYPVTIGGPGVTNPKTTGLIVPGLDPNQVDEFVNMLRMANSTQQAIDRVKEKIAQTEADRAFYTYWNGTYGTYGQTAAGFTDRIAKLRTQLASLQTEFAAIGQAFDSAGFNDLLAVGFPQGLNDDNQRDLGAGGIGFSAALLAFQRSLTSVNLTGLERTDGPVEFVVTAVGPGLVAKGIRTLAMTALGEIKAAGVGGIGIVARKGAATVIIEEHHQLPWEFVKQFKKAGLDIKDFIIKVEKAAHRFKPDGLHTGKGAENWNGAWRQFFKENKNPNRKKILKQLEEMRKDFGLE